MQQTFTFVWTLSFCLIIWVGIAVPSASGKAYLSAADFSISLTTGPELLMDANSGCGAEPVASYVGFEICNTSSDTIANLSASLGEFTGSDFALAGGQIDSQRIGILPPDSCRVLYWYISYDCDNSGASTDLTLTLSNGSGSDVTETESLTVNDVITASAGGVMVSVNDSIGGYVGSVLLVDYLYSFGNMKNNGELYMQPAGNADFDASCFQLIGTEVIESDVNSVDVGDRDQLYYVLSPGTSGSNNQVKLRYFFLSKCEAVSTEAHGFAAATSGSALKLSPNIADPSIDFGFPSASNPFSISKTVDESSVNGGESANYTISITNSSATYVSIDRIQDVLPADMSYDTTTAGSEITVLNASKSPARGDTDTINWWGGTAASTYPYREFLLDPGGSLDLTYSASAAPAAAMGERINYAQAFSGSFETPTVYASLCVGGSPCVLEAGRQFTLEGAYQGAGNALKWRLNSTWKPRLFHVERSTTGLDYKRIGEVEVLRSTGQDQIFRFFDGAPPSEFDRIYYRIRVFEHDGRTSFSPRVEIVRSDRTHTLIQVIPKPNSQGFDLHFEGFAHNRLRVSIRNATGQLLFQGHPLDDRLHISNFPAGIYVIRATDGKKHRDQKLIFPGR